MNAKTESILATSLNERWKNYRAQLKICRNEFSEEAVHDLRVATRRLLAVLDIVRALDPHPRVQKTRRALKNQLDALDDLRDVQVMLVETSETLENLPSLKPFHEHLQKREKWLLRAARKQVRTFKPSELSKRTEKIYLATEKQAEEANFNARLLQVVDDAYLKAMQAYGQIDAAQPPTIHRLRIAFKKFRYMVEIVNPLLINYPETYLKRMHDYQSAMGDIQDVEIFLHTLADFVEKDASFDSEPVRRFYEQHRTDLIAIYLEGKGELHTFWRSAPNQTFPWEKKHEPIYHPPRNRRASGNARLRGRQSASTNRQGPQENAKDRTRVKGTGRTDRPDPDQPISAGDTDGAGFGQGI